jgi:acyl-CoA reductase-like NAD-dependent aldehyde dehydrogenase
MSTQVANQFSSTGKPVFGGKKMENRLIEKKVLIGGEWTESESGERFEVHYPGDGRVIGTVPNCTRKDVQHAVEGAIDGQKRLAELSLVARVNLLYRAMEIAKGRDKESSEIACMESGKVISEARSEASTLQGYSWSNFRVAAENVKIHRGMTIPNATEDSNHKRIIVNREPVGVVVNISTFSYPSEMPNCTIPYALALGNSVIVKPSRGSPLSAILLCEILEEAGFPPGSVSVLTGPGSEIGDELVSSPGTNAVNFFGQTETGERITQRAGIKKLLLALVSNNPLIVMDDANLDEAVGAAVGGCFPLAGQSPISTRRILVHKDVHQLFVERLVEQ